MSQSGVKLSMNCFLMSKKDMKATMAAMDGLPVTFRLLDPPLHEFVPQGAEKQEELAKALGIKKKMWLNAGTLCMNQIP